MKPRMYKLIIFVAVLLAIAVAFVCVYFLTAPRPIDSPPLTAHPVVTFEYFYIRDELNILIRREEHYVESVWKNGDDFRVLIRDDRNSTWDNTKRNWFRFENGIIGEKTYEPPGITMQNPWAGIPGSGSVRVARNRWRSTGFLFTETPNNYPWQVQWGSYFVRFIHCLDTNVSGLWLTKPGAEPVLISRGAFSSPVVIPGTDWVVSAMANEGWQNPNTVVKIDLNTFEKTTIDLPPARGISPVALINDRLLILGRNHAYLFDIATNSLERVEGDFSSLVFRQRSRSSGGLGGRFFQPTKVPGEYFAMANQGAIGVININTFEYTPLVNIWPLWVRDYTRMWMDELNNVVYLAIFGDLVKVQFCPYTKALVGICEHALAIFDNACYTLPVSRSG